VSKRYALDATTLAPYLPASFSRSFCEVLAVPRIRSAKKRLRQSTAARERNRQQRTALRTAIRKVRAAESGAQAADAFDAAESQLDRAARKRLIHPRTAARQKRRLAKAAKAAQAK
jgi:small subunit ribosomal protein S20